MATFKHTSVSLLESSDCDQSIFYAPWMGVYISHGLLACVSAALLPIMPTTLVGNRSGKTEGSTEDERGVSVLVLLLVAVQETGNTGGVSVSHPGQRYGTAQGGG